ncbi:hypothetical protein GOBAR_AA34617 [Gossypium barbadense]|uniref:Uncharacterized protein n=1 Tax=Gossypium barbadense TaxID=3634 RepID=A0A2P5W4S9_GOSBA|nr:hypothetical protein GOBAR_AA34617 [Gossypium barbadense]
MSAYEPPHELDERVVVAESVGPRAVGGHHQEYPPCKYLRDGGITDALERPGLYEAVLGTKVCQHFEGEKCLKQHQTLGRLAGGLIPLGETEPCRDHHTLSLRSRDGTLSIVPPNRYSGPQLKVGPEVFRAVLPGTLGETVGEGDGFPQLGPRKRTLPFSSSKQVRRFSFLLTMTCYLRLESSSHLDEWSK